MPRNVEYEYGDADPERVTALLEAGTGTHFATYTFDEAGNQTSRCYGATYAPTCAGESMELIYDGNDQLRRAVKKQNGAVVGSEEYFYGLGGQRFAVVARNSAGSNTELTWFIGDTEAHYTGGGSVSHVYSHLSLGTPVLRVDRTANNATSLQFQFRGLANNTLASVAYDGTVKARFSYSPFGEVLEAQGTTGGPASISRRFNDKHQSTLTALAYYGARYYDRIAATWTQADPVYVRIPDLGSRGAPRRASVYTFSLNNPLRYLDPDGLDAGHLSSYVSEADASSSGRARNLIEAGGGIDKDSCAYNSSRCFTAAIPEPPPGLWEDIHVGTLYDWYEDFFQANTGLPGKVAYPATAKAAGWVNSVSEKTDPGYWADESVDAGREAWAAAKAGDARLALRKFNDMNAFMQAAVLITAAEIMVCGRPAARGGGGGAALVIRGSISRHAAERMAERGITESMVRRAIESGTRYYDRLHGTVSHVLERGMASGKTLQISRNPATGNVTTGIIRRRFNPEVLLEDGTRRFVPMGQ